MALLTLGDLVTPEGVAAFLERFAAKTCWHQAAARAAEVDTLLPWCVIEGLVANGLIPADSFRVVVNGNELSSTMYGDARGRLRSDAMVGFAAQGATLIITDIGALVPAIGELTAAMERDLRCKVNVNCYVTFGAASAFLAHHDCHDVLCVQIHGVKRWRTYDPVVAFPVSPGRSGSKPVLVWEGLMTPGDLLYLPRGVIHAAVPERPPSVHLTFGISEATGIDFIQWLATKAKDVEVLRRDMGAILTGRDRAVRDQELASALRALLDEVTVADFFGDQDQERLPLPLAALRACQSGAGLFLPEAELISALRRRLDLGVDLTGEILVSIGKRQYRLSQLSRRALAEITRHQRITVAALAATLDCEAEDRAIAASLEDLAGKSLIAIAT